MVTQRSKDAAAARVFMVARGRSRTHLAKRFASVRGGALRARAPLKFFARARELGRDVGEVCLDVDAARREQRGDSTRSRCPTG